MLGFCGHRAVRVFCRQCLHGGLHGFIPLSLFECGLTHTDQSLRVLLYDLAAPGCQLRIHESGVTDDCRNQEYARAQKEKSLEGLLTALLPVEFFMKLAAFLRQIVLDHLMKDPEIPLFIPDQETQALPQKIKDSDAVPLIRSPGAESEVRRVPDPVRVDCCDRPFG